MRRQLAGAAWILAIAILAFGCGEDPTAPQPPVVPGFLEPDFSLVDLNPVSSTYQATHSPRQYLGQVSAWYFGAAT